MAGGGVGAIRKRWCSSAGVVLSGGREIPQMVGGGLWWGPQDRGHSGHIRQNPEK